MNRKLITTALAVTAVLVTGCGSGNKSAPTSVASAPYVSSTTPASGSGYNPKIVPAEFTNKITNKYWPLKIGRKWVYTGLKDGAPVRVEVAVTNQKKTILGVPCVVVTDVVTSNHTLVEKTVDWYAQDKKGSVWYFGEDTKEYKNGIVTSTHGTWEAGVDNARPGITVQGTPRPGGFYRQEFRPGQAEDKAQVLLVNDKQTVPAGTYRNVLKTYDIDPLNPDKKEWKWYASGVGVVHVIRFGSAHHEEIKLVSVTG